MIQVRVDSLGGMDRLMHAGWPTHVVSLLGPDVKMTQRIPAHLILRFDDVADPSHSDQPPTREHVREILRFTKDIPAGSKLLVHCHAGQSRSTAIAIGVLIQHGMEADAAWEHVREQRSFMLPNPLICEFLDVELGLNVLFDRAESLRSNDSLNDRRDKMLHLKRQEPGNASEVDSMAEIMARLRKLQDDT